MRVHFFVPGDPKPQGSKKHVGRGIMVESCKKLPAWRSLVSQIASTTMMGDRPFDGPIHLDVTFIFGRPKSHFTKKGLRPNAPTFFNKAPDTDKLIRAIGDAGTGILWTDDKLIISIAARKIYGDIPGAKVSFELADVVIHS